MAKHQATMNLEGPPVESPTLCVNEFLFVNGRLPRIDDPVKPWKYRGWLLPYVQMAEMAIRKGESRWSYMAEIITTGELPDRPIPKLAFEYAPPGSFGHLDKWSQINGYDMGQWHDFEVLLDWFLWGLALAEEPRYHSETAAHRLYREVNVQEMLEHPYDYFGAFISEHKSRGWNRTGFFPTPHTVCECMVQMMMHDEATDGGFDGRYRTVNEPCVGTGRMLLHAAQFSLRLYGQDIDPVVIKCCKINGALYAPWISYPIPDAVFSREDWLTAMGRIEIDDTPPPPTGRHQRSIFDVAIEEDEEVEALT